MRRGLPHSGGRDANEAGFVAQLGQIRGAKIAHAGLDAADQLGQDQIQRWRHFLERFDAFGRNFLGMTYMAEDWDGPLPPEIQKYFEGEGDPEDLG